MNLENLIKIHNLNKKQKSNTRKEQALQTTFPVACNECEREMLKAEKEYNRIIPFDNA